MYYILIHEYTLYLRNTYFDLIYLLSDDQYWLQLVLPHHDVKS